MPSLLDDPAFARAARQIADAALFLAQRGWTPATSSNFSARVEGSPHVAISRSGVDKHAFAPTDVMAVDAAGRCVAPEGARPSAETALHLALYAHDAAIGSVLHVHSLPATVLSLRHERAGALHAEGLEILKGLAGVSSHETRVTLPILPNSQDMPRLAAELPGRLAPGCPGVLIAGHGLYAWGRDVAEARRHVETFEFVLACRLEMERPWRD